MLYFILGLIFFLVGIESVCDRLNQIIEILEEQSNG